MNVFNTCPAKSVSWQTSKTNSEVSKSNSNILKMNIFFSENDVTSEGAVSFILSTSPVFTKSIIFLKTLDTIGNCQRPVFAIGVSQRMYKITMRMWTFELDWSSELRDNYERKHPCHTKLCAFRCLISRPQILNLRSRNQVRGKLLLSRKLRHFRGSRFSQCFILSTSPQPSDQVRFYADNYFE